MNPTNLVLDAQRDLLAADTATFADAADGCKVHLVKADFTSNVLTDVADLTLADFTGSTAKVMGTGTQTKGVDPATGKRFIELKEPAGGLTWVCTAAPSPAQTIYGYVVTDNAGTVTLGSAKFDTPITISAVGHAISIGNIRLTSVVAPLS